MLKAEIIKNLEEGNKICGMVKFNKIYKPVMLTGRKAIKLDVSLIRTMINKGEIVRNGDVIHNEEPVPCFTLGK